MSKLVKLKLASKKSLSCFLPSRMMASPGTSSTLFPDPGVAPDDRAKPNTTAKKRKSVSETLNADHAKPENLERAMVAVEPKKENPPKKEDEEEVLELKTPGFIRLFGCDDCEESEETDDHRHKAHESSSDESMDDAAASSSAHHQPRHLIPVVHLRVPMKNDDDVRKVVAALQLRGVLEVACDVENQIVKVTGNADPDRLLKKVKKVKRKSKLISYSDPVELPIPPDPSTTTFHSNVPPPPPPPYAFHQERFRPPSHGPYNVRPSAFYPPPPPPPPPPTAGFYRDESFYPGFAPRPPSSPPHYRSRGFYHERNPPNLRRSTSPPRRRSYYHERTAPGFWRPPPPPMDFSSAPWGPGGVPYDFHQVPDRMMHMYH